MPPLKIIIVGAGVGGPAVAIGLARNGHDVSIYERSASVSEVGFAFRITANSDRCLKSLGIDTEAGGAVSANASRMYDAKGNTILEFNENTDPQKAKSGTSVFAFRPQLHRQLADTAVQSGVKMYIGIKVKSVDPTTTTIELQDGTKISADLIIACDGVHSLVRSVIVGSDKHSPGASSGHNTLRFMVSKSQVQSDPLLAPIVSNSARMFSWAGNNKRVLVYPVNFDKQFNVTCTHEQSLSDNVTIENSAEAEAVAYNQKIPFSAVKSIYSEFEPRVHRLLEMADPNGFRVWKNLDADEIPTWSKSNVVLLGDACHPVLPFGFSGASMAIEDAATLTALLPVDVEVGQIPSRLKLYEEIRKPRIERVRQTARKIARGEENKELMEGYMRFLSSHDAIQYAEQALRQSHSTQD